MSDTTENQPPADGSEQVSFADAPMPEIDLGIEGFEHASEIGFGGFATVYKAEQPAFRRTVAVKVLNTSLDEQSRQRFERECQAMGSLSEHPNIVTVHGAGFSASKRPYLIMAFLQAGTLNDRVVARGAQPWTDISLIGVELCGALETAHRAGIIHRDIKPENILVSAFGEAQLGDFGIARVAGGNITQSGVITGSIAHMPPEILDGQPPSVQTDIYSLASTLYELIAGQAAFFVHTDESFVPVLRRVLTEPPADLRPRGVPDSIATVLERAMAKDPAQRPATALAFGRELQAARQAAGLDAGKLIALGEATHLPGVPLEATPAIPVANAAAGWPTGPVPTAENSPAPGTVWPAAAYHADPGYPTGPVPANPPDYQTGPIYQAAPGYQTGPVHQGAPGYQTGPVYAAAPATTGPVPMPGYYQPPTAPAPRPWFSRPLFMVAGIVVFLLLFGGVVAVAATKGSQPVDTAGPPVTRPAQNSPSTTSSKAGASPTTSEGEPTPSDGEPTTRVTRPLVSIPQIPGLTLPDIITTPANPATGTIKAQLAVLITSIASPLGLVQASLTCGTDASTGTGYLADKADAACATVLNPANSARLVGGSSICDADPLSGDTAVVTGTIGADFVAAAITRSAGCGASEWTELQPLLPA